MTLLADSSAFAQATRTWVSGVGDDANPCSRTAPCKTFAGAISKTASGGTINCIDPGGFGAVTIVKSITIDCESQAGGILAAGQNGVNINGANIVVHLRNLAIEGAGSGLIGINFINGAALSVENCVITQFAAGSAIGIKFSPPAGVNAELFVTDTMIAANGVGGVGGGILVQPAGTGAAQVVLSRVQVVNNAAGIRGDGGGSTGGINISISDSESSGNAFAGIVSFTPAGGAATKIMITGSTISANNVGINANGAGATLRIGSSVVSGNATGVAIGGGATMTSFGDNQINDNATPGPAIPVVGPT